MPSVLFVCTANICRSPIAMELFRLLVISDKGDWRIESAGVWSDEGFPASKNAQQVIAQRGGDLSGHRSRSVSRDLLIDFELTLTMEQWHKDVLLTKYPDIAGRVFLLSEMTGVNLAVHDPYGGSNQEYDNAANEIEGYLKDGFEEIKRLTMKSNV